MKRHVVYLAVGVGLGCTPQALIPDYTVRPGVEIATVLDAAPGDVLTLYDPSGERLISVIADDLGQAHFAYVPEAHIVLDSREGLRFPVEDGRVLQPGDGYEIRNDETDPPLTSGLFRVWGLNDPVFDVLYERQTLTGAHVSLLGDEDDDPERGFQYVQTRDGTLLSVMVRLPDPQLYGDGPYPTVIEYSGYSPSRPDYPDTGSQIANALGYATVGVNMRGTGCSGGVFDVFNRAQHADGYDVVEVVARQDWVLHGHVGMVGLSYPGISQLYVASTNPPSLAAIVPLSTIADAWEMQWPGGVYNAGFTRQWVEEREAQAIAGGTSWVSARIEAGDTTCADNLELSAQSIDFESFFRALEMRPRDADDRDLTQLAAQIEAPVFLGGGFQDEQTGAQFGAMLDRFTRSPSSRFLLYNGRHPDGYTPDAVSRWFEFLEFHVAQRIPRLHPALRIAGAEEFASVWGFSSYAFEPDRFTAFGEDFAAAKAAYEAEDPIRLLFEVGAGGPSAGTPVARFETSLTTWPPPEAAPITWHLAADGVLATTPPATAGADAWRFDPEAGETTFFGPRGYELLRPLWDIDWQPFPEGASAAYLTAPFAAPAILTGPGIATLWVRSPVDDVTVQVTLTEVRPDGNEVLVQSGWLRLGHRAAERGDDLRLVRTYAKEDFAPVPLDTWVQAEVTLPSVAHPIRAGSSLRMIVSSPGRDHGTWEFGAPDYDDPPTFHLGRGGAQASSLTMATLPGIEIPETYPPCPSLRGQPCRTYAATANTAAE